MERFLRFITPEVQSLVENKRTSEAIYALEETISWSLVQLALIWSQNFTNLAKSEEYLRTAIKIVPGSWQFHVNLAHILNLRNDFENAKQEALKSVACSEASIYEPFYNLGVILTNLLDHEGAINAYRVAERLWVSNGNNKNLAAYNVSASLLALGKWKEGWEAYEKRFSAFDKVKAIHGRFRVHLRHGDATKGRKIYVYSEQGVGDLIQFARWLPKLKSSTGASITIEPQIAISKLIEDNFKLDKIVPRIDGSWPDVPEDVDYAISICSLPSLFDAGIKPMPNKPYIKAPDRELPDVLKVDGLKVGLCWAGNADHVNDCKRSLYLSQLKPLFDIDNVKFFSFQKDTGAPRIWNGKHVNLYDANVPAIDLSPNFNNFSDTAYFINQMDLMITVDTSIAHLSGAMGKPTWLMIDKHNDWRWKPEGTTSEWYPSMRIFRQKGLYDWTSVVEELAKELAAYQIPQQDQNEVLSCGKKGSRKRRSRKHSH